MKLGIFTSFNGIHQKFVDVCKELNLEYEVIDILSADWISKLKNSGCDGFLCSSTCDFQERKTILDERYFFISEVMNFPIYPSFTELYIHENKRNMSSWLEINNFPHPKTRVFVNKQEANNYFESAKYPIVLKSNLGAAASKIRIIKNKNQAKRISRKVFPRKYTQLNMGLIYLLKVKGVKIFPDLASPQKFYLIAQEFIDLVHEWRIIKIGNSFFGHQKLLDGKFASGSGKVAWIKPPEKLLLLVKNICDTGGFHCMAVDIFESKSGEYFVNELQTSFGSYLNSQMYIDEKPGRYKFIDNSFVFEEGFFNVHGSNKLKVEHFLEILKEKHE